MMNINPTDNEMKRRKENASQLLQHILAKENPPQALLKDLYGLSIAGYAERSIDVQYQVREKMFGRVRAHKTNVYHEILNTRKSLNNNSAFQDIVFRINTGKRSEKFDAESLRSFYGEFADSTAAIFNLYKQYDIKRKCGLPSIAHLHRVAGIVSALEFDKDDYPFMCTAIASHHDVLEDLFTLKPKSKKEMPAVFNYEEFVNKNIPERLRRGVLSLTNVFDVVLHHTLVVLHDKDLLPNKKNLQKEIFSLSEPGEYPTLAHAANIILTVLDSFDEKPETDIYTEVKWKCYKNFYITHLGDGVIEQKDHRILEIKSIDLSDNGHGSEALALDSQVRNILKHQVYVNRIKKLNSDWKPIKDRMNELQEDALDRAENIVLSYLMKDESVQDFIVAGMKYIERMKSVFFTDKEP